MAAVRELIRRSRVLDLGPLPAPRLVARAAVQQGLQFMVRGKRGAIVIVDKLRPVGIFTERDVIYRLPEGVFASREQRQRMTLEEVMSSPPLTIRRQATLQEAIEMMVGHQYRHLVIVDSAGDLRGLLNSQDLVQFITDQFPEETVNLPPRLRQHYSTRSGA